MSWVPSSWGSGGDFWNSISIPWTGNDLGFHLMSLKRAIFENGHLLEIVAASCSLSFFSEFGDATFFIALVLSATQNTRFKVFSGALFANIIMVFISGI